jgi:transposase
MRRRRPRAHPQKTRGRVKTDRKDAEKLAWLHRLGELATVFVPTPAQEALRDLLRTREDAREDLLRRRHRLSKFLFRSPRELMAFIGVVPRERSSGGREQRGSITKTGNAHIRRVLIESAWHYQRLPAGTPKTILVRREGQPPEVIETARKAELRLHRKFMKLLGRGKPKGVAAVAVARELAGFIWALGRG